jgi:hypothetical protein
MALGGILGAALTTPNTTLATLTYIDNIYVKPTPSSINVTMGGYGTNSSYTFTLDDPTVSIVISPDSVIRFEHVTAGTLFCGFVESFTYRTSFGGQGRQIDVVCVGNEIILDWLVTSVALTFSNNGTGPSGPGEWSVPEMVARIMANLTGPTGPLRWNYKTAPSDGSSVATPVGATGTQNDPTKTFTIAAGSTLRAALQGISDGLGIGQFMGSIQWTIDPWYGLRILGSVDDKQDWSILPTGPNYPSDIRHVTDNLGLIRSVLVTGTGVSAFVTDGTGIIGATAFYSYPACTTTQQCQLFGAGYLSQRAGGHRGEVGLDARTDVFYQAVFGTATIGPNASIGTTAASIGPNRGSWPIKSVDLSNFLGTGVYDARFHYGGVEPSAANLIRSLTRSVTS